MASDHRGNPVHAGKRTYQSYQDLPGVGGWYDPGNSTQAYGGWEDKGGPAMSYSPRKPSPKGPQNMGAAKAY